MGITVRHELGLVAARRLMKFKMTTGALDRTIGHSSCAENSSLHATFRYNADERRQHRLRLRRRPRL